MKLKDALEVLKTHSFCIPDEYNHKLSKYEEQIRSMGERLRQEKLLLQYLHINVLPKLEKKITYCYDLLLVALATVLMDAGMVMLSFNDLVVRIIGLPLLLIFPGYAMLAVAFPRFESLDMLQRVAFSLVSSIAVMLLLGFGLNGTSLRAIDMLLGLTIAILGCCAIAILRRNRDLATYLYTISKKVIPAEDQE